MYYLQNGELTRTQPIELSKEDVLGLDIDCLPLSVRGYCALKRHNINKIKDMKLERLILIKGIGEKTFKEIRQCLEKFDLID